MAPPYDKSPEWEKLTGHSAEVRACCIGNRESGHPLIATASDDSTVQLWDTRIMPSPKIVKLPVSIPHSEPLIASFSKTDPQQAFHNNVDLNRQMDVYLYLNA